MIRQGCKSDLVAIRHSRSIASRFRGDGRLAAYALFVVVPKIGVVQPGNPEVGRACGAFPRNRRFARRAAIVSAINSQSFLAGMISVRRAAGWEDARLMFNLAGIETVATGPACQSKEYFAVPLRVNFVFRSDWR